jgi:hypothetical protein
MDNTTIQDLTRGIMLAKSAVELAASGFSLIPDGTKKEAAKVALEQAKQAFIQAELHAAVDLGHVICQCTWPSQICTRPPNGKWKCPHCGGDPSSLYSS